MNTSIKRIVGEKAQQLGFTQYKHGWQRFSDDLLHIIGLQRSRWGGAHYINIGIWVNPSNPEYLPRPETCHLQCRIDSVPGAPADLGLALDEEDYWRMDANHRRDLIYSALINAESKFFRELNSKADIQSFISLKKVPQLAITKELRAMQN